MCIYNHIYSLNGIQVSQLTEGKTEGYKLALPRHTKNQGLKDVKSPKKRRIWLELCAPPTQDKLSVLPPLQNTAVLCMLCGSGRHGTWMSKWDILA